jgi:hypothetical protein
MSRFADKLKNALQVAPPPMGFFRSVQPCSKPRMLLVAWAALEDIEKLQPLLDRADAAVLASPKIPAAKTLKASVKSLCAIPVGLQIEADGANLKALDAAGVDFVAFAPEKIPLSSISEEKPGRVVSIPLDIEDSLVRTLNELPVDAIVINTSDSSPLTFSDLMRLRRLGDWITRPLLAVVPLPITEAEIKALWDAGIDALAVSLCEENAEAFKELRATLDGLTFTTKRKWMKPHAIVPVVRQEESAHAEEPDEGDGDDEV